MTALDQMLDWQDTCHEEYNQFLDDLEVKMANDRFAVDKNEWKEKMEEVASKDGKYLFPEKGNTRVRLLLAPERMPVDFWQPVVTTYYEKARTRIMIPVLMIDEHDSYTLDVKWMITAKTVLQQILELLYNGYELLHPETAVGIIISRTGEGLNTRYNVMPTKDVVPVDYDSLEFEDTLLKAGQAFELSQGKKEEDEDDLPF